MNNAACGDPGGNHDIANASIAAVLEPGTLALAAIGGLGLASRQRWRAYSSPLQTWVRQFLNVMAPDASQPAGSPASLGGTSPR